MLWIGALGPGLVRLPRAGSIPHRPLKVDARPELRGDLDSNHQKNNLSIITSRLSVSDSSKVQPTTPSHTLRQGWLRSSWAPTRKPAATGESIATFP